MPQTRDHVSVHIGTLLLQQRSSPTSSTIFRVDHDLRHGSENLYDPKVVSIGPFHHQKTRLQNMQQHKLTYLNHLLTRREESTVDRYVEAVRSMEEEARNSYSEPIEPNRDKLVEILVLDGLFVVELVRKYKLDYLRMPDDPIIQYEQVLGRVRRDLMLVENQVPFFVLDQLFNMTKGGNPDDDIFHLVHYFFDDISPWPDFTRKPVANNAIDHLLGLVYKIWFSDCFSLFETMEAGSPVDEKIMAINSASELQEIGVKFKRSKRLNITFDGGVLKIPNISLCNETESIFRNLIAYEQFFADGRPKYVTVYAFFLHWLVNQPKDVEILRRRSILTNLLGGDEMVYRVFERLGRNVMVSSCDFLYAGVFEALNKYCGRRTNRWMAVLRRDYFSSPWSFIKFFAACLLLLFTLIQTMFTVKSSI
ncbi:Plant protein of unknown function (DUF247 [Striga hermonthica]|uniref:Uncharacterized protein n=1 Tax=Striga hermonthica TaxID=68872 RepID=A0A9N7MTV4_STRHE|nr:Plant protein of unknown function (DUF247 [Striga hermonthica]